MNYLKSEKTGELIKLNREITRGGEAIIYETNKAGFVAKIYLKSPPSDTWDKLLLMISNPPQQPILKNGHISIVWPQSILTDQGIPKGFLLPYISDTLEFSVLYHPRSRKQNAPAFNWKYLHATAMNIAACVSSIHAKKYVIGDINGQNILVKRNTYISIIDTDSFQVTNPYNSKVYRCNVGVEEYTPPEMHEKSFRNYNRHEVQDRFGLAVLIWQLLFNDHPFSGKWNGSGDPPSLGEKIAQGYWVYSKNSRISPGQRTISFNVIHPQLQALFFRCFYVGHSDPNVRPSASDWQSALGVAINDLQRCSVAGEQHYYSKSYGQCYWCERKGKIGVDIFENPNTSLSKNTNSFSLPIVYQNNGTSGISKKTLNSSIFTSPVINIPTINPPNSLFIPATKVTPTAKTFSLKLLKFQHYITISLFFFCVLIYLNWQFEFQKLDSDSQSSVNQTLALNLDPHETIIKYYELAPNNKTEAIKLLSDSWRQKSIKDTSNWWNSVRKVEVYNFQTFANNNSKAKVKIWLKYYMKNGHVACESLIFNLIFDQNNGVWLMNNVEPNSVVQNANCDTK